MVHVSRDGEEIGAWPETEFRDRIFRGEVFAEDYYWREGMPKWVPVSTYRPSAKTVRILNVPAKLPVAVTPKPKKPTTPGQIGALCAAVAAFAPLVSPMLFFVLSLPLLLAALVLAIVSLVRGRIAGGIALMIGVFLAGPTAFTMLVDRDRLLSTEGRGEILRK